MKSEEKKQAFELRIQGWSYGRISEKLNVSKGTISLWLRDHPFSEELKIKLQEQNWRVDSIVAGRRYKEIWDERRQKVFGSYEPPLYDPQFMLGLGLYWGEGSKSTRSTRSATSLSNTDPGLLRNFILWCKTYFAVSNFSAAIQHHDESKLKESEIYWSKEFNLPLSCFTKSVIAISKSSLKKRNTLPYGTARINAKGKNIWEVRCKIEKALWLVGSVKNT